MGGLSRSLFTSSSSMASTWNPFELETTLPSYHDDPCLSDCFKLEQMEHDEASASVHSSERLKEIEADLQKVLLSEISELVEQEDNTSPISSVYSVDTLNNEEAAPSSNGQREMKLINEERDPTDGISELSTEEIMRIASAHFIQLSDHGYCGPSMLSYSLGLSNSSLMSEDIKNIDLASLLLEAAEKVSNQQYDPARSLIQECFRLSSIIGNPIQRVVYYFADALQERIDKSTGCLSTKRQREKVIPAQSLNEGMINANPLQLVFDQKVPMPKVMQFLSVQAIIDTVASAKRIHMIDLSIRHGPHWIILMQALAARSTCPIDYLRISAVGTSEASIAIANEILVSFAETLSLPFEFKAVIVKDMKHLKEEMLGVVEGEAVGVHSSFFMNAMLSKTDSLEVLVKVLQRVKPCIMTAADVEANINSTSFITRFTEVLFHHSALFDSLDGCMDRNDLCRLEIEGGFFSKGIKSIIATEGRERLVRHVGISTWRSFFARYEIEEIGFNDQSPYQVKLLVRQFHHGSYCTIQKDGKSLLIRWKGTPLYFLSAWKFSVQGRNSPIKC